jgi:hypothetical protein
MRCILCFQKLIIGINPRTQARKGLVSYYKTNGIISFKKHVAVDHYFIAQMFEKKVNNLLRRSEERQPS